MRTLCLLTLTSLTAVCAHAQGRRVSSPQDLQAKVALESSVERRLQEVLRKVLGAEEVVVVVNVDMVGGEAAERPDGEILPGVSVKEAPGTPAAPLELPASLVRRLTVTIFLDRTTSDVNVELARSTAAQMVGLKSERGDTVAVTKMDFPKKKTLTPAESFRAAFLEPHGFLALSWLLVACMALVLLSRRFFDPFVSAVKDAARGLAEKSSAAPAAAGAPAAAAAEAAAEKDPVRDAARADAGDESARRIPFSFVRDRDLPTLNMLLAEADARTVAAIVNFLSPALASAALAAMSAERRDEVVAQMAAPVLLNPADVQALEESIRSRIDCMIGGEDKLAEILDQSPVDMQAEILETLRYNDEDLWDRLQRRVIVFDDLALLDEAGIATLSRAIPLKSMAVALKSSPALARAVTAKLKTGLGQWLKQEIDLTGRVPEDVRQAETRRVVKALAQLVREGRVVLRKDLAPPPASYAPVEEAAAEPEAAPAGDGGAAP